MLSHLEGELFVARSSYVAPVRAAELPPELRSAIDSPLAGVREGVVSELARLLSGHDPAVGEAARVALRHLADDDSRRVGTAAAAALAVPVAEPAAPEATPERRRVTPSAAPAATPEPPRTAAAEAPAGTARTRIVRWGPLALSVVGALVVVGALAVFDADASDSPLRHAEAITGVAVVVAAAISALGARGVRRAVLDALEPVLAGFPIGLAAAAGGVQEMIGLYFSPRALALGGALQVASVVWRRWRRASRPGWPVVVVVVIGSVLVFISPGSPWWGDQLGTDLLLWPLTVGIVIAAIVAVLGVAVARAGSGDAWVALAAVAGGAALFAAVSMRDYTGIQGDDSNSGLALALIGGLVVAAACVYAQLRPDRR